MRIYLDLEYLYPGMTRAKGRPTGADLRQVVQIAAVRFDEVAGHEIESFDILTLPIYDRVLPPFFTELTGITQELVDTNGIPFCEGLARFAEFVGDAPVWIFMGDEDVLRQNCGYIGADFPFHRPFTRVKPLLPQWGIDPEKYSSGTLYQVAGLDMTGWVHNALHDVRSMSRAVHFFERRTAASPE